MTCSRTTEGSSLLGSPPWDKEHLRRCYFRDFRQTRHELDQFEGGVIFNELKSLRLSLSIFVDAVDDLMTLINRFKFESSRPEFWHQTNRHSYTQIETKIQRGMLSSAMCAMALVDHSRAFVKKYPIDGYEEQVAACFQKDDRHRFIHSLRVGITHLGVTKANWEINVSKEGRTVSFLLRKDDLLRWNNWNAQAKSFILAHEKGVDVEALFEAYSRHVEKFHNWFRISLFNKYGATLSEYLRYLRIVNSFESQANWNLLLKQIVPQQKIDPYMYLGQYLTEEQLEDVFSLPFRSKEQIDRIIALVDVYRVCTNELREDAYRVCGAKTTSRGKTSPDGP